MSTRRRVGLLLLVLVLQACSPPSKEDVLPAISEAEAAGTVLLHDAFGPGEYQWTREIEPSPSMICGWCVYTESSVEVPSEGSIGEAIRILEETATAAGWRIENGYGDLRRLTDGEVGYSLTVGGEGLVLTYRSAEYQVEPFTITIENECGFAFAAHYWWGSDDGRFDWYVAGVPSETLSISAGHTESYDELPGSQGIVFIPRLGIGRHISEMRVGGAWTWTVSEELCANDPPTDFLRVPATIDETMAAVLPGTAYEVASLATSEPCEGPAAATYARAWGVEIPEGTDPDALAASILDYWETAYNAIGSVRIGPTHIRSVNGSTPNGLTLDAGVFVNPEYPPDTMHLDVSGTCVSLSR